MRILIALLIVVGLAAPAAGARALDDGPTAHASAVCADYPNQAAAQRAADTVDADGDGIYCESLPCPCLKPGGRPRRHPAADRRRPHRRRRRRPTRRLPATDRRAADLVLEDQVPEHPPPRRARDRQGLADDARAQPAGRRRAPRPAARVLGHAARPRPRRVPARRRPRPRRRPDAGQRPARLEGRRRLRALEREPQPRLDAWASSCGASATARSSATSSTSDSSSAAHRPARGLRTDARAGAPTPTPGSIAIASATGDHATASFTVTKTTCAYAVTTAPGRDHHAAPHQPTRQHRRADLGRRIRDG